MELTGAIALTKYPFVELLSYEESVERISKLGLIVR